MIKDIKICLNKCKLLQNKKQEGILILKIFWQNLIFSLFIKINLIKKNNFKQILLKKIKAKSQSNKKKKLVKIFSKN